MTESYKTHMNAYVVDSMHDGTGFGGGYGFGGNSHGYGFGASYSDGAGSDYGFGDGDGAGAGSGGWDGTGRDDNKPYIHNDEGKHEQASATR